MDTVLSLCIVIGLWGVSHSIDQLRRKLTEIYNHSLHVDDNQE